MNCIAIERLTEICDALRAIDAHLGSIDNHLRNLDTLEERRQKDRERQDKCRHKATTCHVTEKCHVTKEREKGKETFPPAPPIEKREKSKKGGGEGEDARAREVSSDILQAERLRENRIAKVAAYNAELAGDIDAEYFVDYYADRWPRDWCARLRNWLKEGKTSGRITPAKVASEKKAPPRVYGPADWVLCAERCANCDGTRCTCGIATPPACAMRPHPPEECPRFVMLDDGQPKGGAQ